MKKIGQGWQYSVYDLGNSRVLKKFHPWIKRYWVILKTVFPFKNDSFWAIPSYVNSMKRKAEESIAILKKRNIPSHWTGNPEFINELDFEQDKVMPLHEILAISSMNEGRKVIDMFISFNKDLLSLGVIDKSFNITKNFGFANGKIILMDIGELLDDPPKIKRQCENRAWAKSYITDYIKNEELKKYFILEMDRSFTNC